MSDTDPKADPPALPAAPADESKLAEANARIMRLGEEINSIKQRLQVLETPPPPRKPGIFKPRRVS